MLRFVIYNSAANFFVSLQIDIIYIDRGLILIMDFTALMVQLVVVNANE